MHIIRTIHTLKKPLLLIFTACMAGIALWRLAPLLAHLFSVQGVWSLAFSPDGKGLAAGGGWEVPHAGGGLDGTVWIWDAKTGELQQRITLLSKQVNWLAYSPDGSSLATWQYDDKVYSLWDSKTGKLIQQARMKEPNSGPSPIEKHWLSADEMNSRELRMSPLAAVAAKLPKGSTPVAISSDSNVAAFVSSQSGIQIWDISAKKLKTQIKREGGGSPQATALSHDAGILAIKASDGPGYELWDAKNGKLLRLLKSRSRNKHLVTFSPDSTKLATEDYQGLIEIWETSSGKLLNTIRVF